MIVLNLTWSIIRAAIEKLIETAIN